MTVSTPLHFLVVDDNEDIREIMAHVVELLGHNADQACDGAEALEALAVQRYDFMLLDLTMPRMTGQDVLRWLRDHPEWATDLHVIVISAWAKDQQVMLKELGAYAVLPKPLRVQQLHDLVDSVKHTT